MSADVPPPARPEPQQPQFQPQPQSQPQLPMQPPPLQPPAQVPAPMPGAPAWGQAWGQAQQPPYPPPQFPGQQPQYGAPQYPGQVPQYPVAPPAPRGWRSNRLAIGLAAALALVVVGSGIYRIAGRHDSSSVSAVTCNPEVLTSCLIAKPGSANSFNDAWGSSTTPTVDQYISYLYGGSSTIAQQNARDNLTNAGLKDIAHTAWKGSNSDQIDIVLLRFDTADGAKAESLNLTGHFVSDAYGRSAPVKVADTAAYMETADSDGLIPVRYAIAVGDILLVEHFYSPGTMDSASFQAWTGAEAASLKSAPTPHESPTPTPTTETVTCADGLSGCLMPPPSGTTPWDTAWGRDHSPSVDDEVNEFYSDATTKANAKGRLVADGVTKIAHDDWNTTNGDGADLLVTSLATTAGAKGAFSDAAWDPTGKKSFTVPGYSDVSALYDSTKDSDGYTNGLIVGRVGTVVMEMYVFSQSTFSPSRFASWAVTELDLLRQHSTQHTVTVAPPAIPTLAAVTGTPAAACSESGQTPALSGCLAPVPSGASADTGGSYDASTSVTIPDFVARYWGDETADQRSYETSLLTSDGADAVAHRAWTSGDGTWADDVLIHFSRSYEAQASSLSFAGVEAGGTVPCSTAALPDAYCSISPQNAQGDVKVEVIGYRMAVEMRLVLFCPVTANVSDALSWAQQQLNALPGS